MNTDVRLTMEELSRLSGYPRRTIRFYIQQELIPPPIGAGLGAYYTAEHLQGLNRIRDLRAQGLRLDEIRQMGMGMEKDILRSLAQHPAPDHHPTSIPRVRDAAPAEAYRCYQLDDGFLLLTPQPESARTREYLRALRNVRSIKNKADEEQ